MRESCFFCLNKIEFISSWNFIFSVSLCAAGSPWRRLLLSGSAVLSLFCVSFSILGSVPSTKQYVALSGGFAALGLSGVSSLPLVLVGLLSSVLVARRLFLGRALLAEARWLVSDLREFALFIGRWQQGKITKRRESEQNNLFDSSRCVKTKQRQNINRGYRNLRTFDPNAPVASRLLGCTLTNARTAS